jgi:hypothetical protein
LKELPAVEQPAPSLTASKKEFTARRPTPPADPPTNGPTYASVSAGVLAIINAHPSGLPTARIHSLLEGRFPTNSADPDALVRVTLKDQKAAGRLLLEDGLWKPGPNKKPVSHSRRRLSKASPAPKDCYPDDGAAEAPQAEDATLCEVHNAETEPPPAPADLDALRRRAATLIRSEGPVLIFPLATRLSVSTTRAAKALDHPWFELEPDGYHLTARGWAEMKDES